MILEVEVSSTTEDFIKKAFSVHGDKYTYDKCVYVRARDKVIITCGVHGDFLQTPNGHLSGKGCSTCVGRGKSTKNIISEFVSVHDNRYDYSKVEYVNYATKVCIICEEHGEFWQNVANHLRGQGCPECGRVKLEESRQSNATRIKMSKVLQPEDHKIVPLTQGKFAKVSNEDFDKVKDINWYYDGRYAKSNVVGYMHRYILDVEVGKVGDHIDGDMLNNQRDNLRLATPAENSANSGPKKDSSTPYKGVTLHRAGGYLVKFTYKGECKLHRRVDTGEEAAMLYDTYALKYWGSFARLNFPELREYYRKELENLV